MRPPVSRRNSINDRLVQEKVHGNRDNFGCRLSGLAGFLADHDGFDCRFGLRGHHVHDTENRKAMIIPAQFFFIGLIFFLTSVALFAKYMDEMKISVMQYLAFSVHFGLILMFSGLAMAFF